ncbi:MAG: TetR/AcrR family transcriptional regulator [Sciscionella sp.]|nr:TetR/AcrR family transcriptional regulator [Sciscionella sp.]
MPTDVRNALLDAGRQLLDRGGVDTVTLREVGHIAGVSHNAPYKHFASKEALLAAIAAEELRRQTDALAVLVKRKRSAKTALRAVMLAYVEWATAYPARFKLIFGTWSIESAELATAADDAHRALVEVVASAQKSGVLPTGDPLRLASLLRAQAHGVADLASVGHLSRTGKGHADPADLIDDLLRYLHAVAAVN